MDTEKFWSMIEDARHLSAANTEKQQWEFLVDALCDLSVDDIQEFDRILWLMMAQAYRADVWNAAWLVACGCGDDAFEDFRNWLIAQGQLVYESVLDDPEKLADIVDKKHRFDIFEGWMSSTAAVAYERKTKMRIPETGYREKPVLVGGSLAAEVKVGGSSEAEAELLARYPRIIEKIGGCDDDELPF